MDVLDALGVPPPLRFLLRPPPWVDAHPAGDALQAPEDRAWAFEHPHGYGSVDAPSPFGYDRDLFAADHPGYAGGYYDPSTGFYSSPTEVPFVAAGPMGPSLVGTGAPPLAGMPFSPESSPAMAGVPAGGGSGGDDNLSVSDAYASPESSPAMANLPTGGDSGDDHRDQQGGGFDLGAFLEALSQAANDGGDRA